MKVTIVPIVIGAFGTITKGLLKDLEDMEVGEQVETIRMTALLTTARIPRRVLESWGELLSLKLLAKVIKRTSGDHRNYCIIEIGKNNEKSSGALRRLAVTQTPGNYHQLILVWKLPSANTGVKNSKRVNNNNNKLQHHWERSEYWEESWRHEETCYYKNSCERPSVKTDVKNSQGVNNNDDDDINC